MKISKRMRTTVFRCAGILIGACTAVAPALAADPTPQEPKRDAKPGPDPKAKASRDKRAADPKLAEHEDFEERRVAAAANHTFQVPAYMPTAAELQRFQFQGTIERLGDNGVLVSVPYQSASEKHYQSLGFRRVTELRHAGDKTLFQGRVRQTYDINPGLAREARKSQGQEVTLVFQRTHFGSEIVEIRPAR